MKINDYANTLAISSADGTVKEYALPTQRIEGLNDLFDRMQSIATQFNSGGALGDDDFKIHIARHGITRLRSWGSTLLIGNWVDELLRALQ